MSVIDRDIPIAPSLREAISWVGVLAYAAGETEAHHLCAQLALRLSGEERVKIHVSVAHVLCQLCDKLREQGDYETVAEIERIVKALKRGQQRVVTGSISLIADTPGELYGKLEKLGDAVLKQRERL